ncbi:MAG: hypothetical protein JEZ11_06700 [Desulfobacterales bacterium]|nr:hypothetical protein [Desulfobacterales bacterium]
MIKRSSFKLAVRRNWLLFLAGVLWSGVGLGLCKIAWHWLGALPIATRGPLSLAGFLGAVTAWRFAFSAIALKNIDRLRRLSEKQCLFAFQSRNSYLIIIFMICLGFLLRHSPVPRPWLAVVYATIGGALLLASAHYYLELAGRRKPGS